MANKVPAFLAGAVTGALALWAIQHTSILDDLRSCLASQSVPKAQADLSAVNPSYQIGLEHVDVRFIKREWDTDAKMMIGGFVSGSVRNPHDVGFDNVEIVVQSRWGDSITIQVGYVEPKGSTRFRSNHSLFDNPRVTRVRGTPVTPARKP